MSSRPPKYQMIGNGPIWDWEDAKYFMQTSHKVTKVENTCEKSHKVTKVENTLCKQSCKLSRRVENTLVLRLTTTQPSVHVHTVLFYYLSTSWSKPLLVVKMTFVVVTKLIVIIVIDYKCSIGRKIISKPVRRAFNTALREDTCQDIGLTSFTAFPVQANLYVTRQGLDKTKGRQVERIFLPSRPSLSTCPKNLCW